MEQQKLLVKICLNCHLNFYLSCLITQLLGVRKKFGSTKTFPRQ